MSPLIAFLYSRRFAEIRGQFQKEHTIADLTVAEKPSPTWALAEALAANLIWASSFVLVKIALNELGPMTITGLRYFVGFLVLIPLMARNGSAASIRALSRRAWIRLALIGICAYPIGNGLLVWGLQFMPATTGSFLLALSPLLVLFLGIFWLKEIPTQRQAVGLTIAMLGSGFFFSPGLAAGEPFAIAIASLGLIGFAFFGILGREVARDNQVDTLSLTALPLAIGGAILLIIAGAVEGLPHFSPTSLFIVLWLAAINTALAYLVYNHSLQVMTAFEMNVLNNLAPLITAGMAWLFLGEKLEPIQAIGIVVALAGIILVQRRV
ncbi:MAG: EamA family transporter [Chloroflexi bacterium]|nr:EamA family transporter [Chloroflexota bacterium]